MASQCCCNLRLSQNRRLGWPQASAVLKSQQKSPNTPGGVRTPDSNFNGEQRTVVTGLALLPPHEQRLFAMFGLLTRRSDVIYCRV